MVSRRPRFILSSRDTPTALSAILSWGRDDLSLSGRRLIALCSSFTSSAWECLPRISCGVVGGGVAGEGGLSDDEEEQEEKINDAGERAAM